MGSSAGRSSGFRRFADLVKHKVFENIKRAVFINLLVCFMLLQQHSIWLDDDYIDYIVTDQQI